MVIYKDLSRLSILTLQKDYLFMSNFTQCQLILNSTTSTLYKIFKQNLEDIKILCGNY